MTTLLGQRDDPFVFALGTTILNDLLGSNKKELILGLSLEFLSKSSSEMLDAQLKLIFDDILNIVRNTHLNLLSNQ